MLVALAVSGFTTACSATGRTVTCDQYAAEKFTDQTSTLSDLLNAHDVAPGNMVNVMGVTNAVSQFCGETASELLGGHASRNNSRPIDDAVDWNSKTW